MPNLELNWASAGRSRLRPLVEVASRDDTASLARIPPIRRWKGMSALARWLPPGMKMARKSSKPKQVENILQPEEVVPPSTGEPPGTAEPLLPQPGEKAVERTAAGQVAEPVDQASAAAGNASDDQAVAAAQEDTETRSKRAFFGRSGHLAVMAEFLHRRINVAIPEVDVGDDIFVVKGVAVEVTRVQVKGATAREQQNSYFALINVPEDQLSVPQDNPPLVYIFPIRRREGKQGRWFDFMVIRRGTLYARYINDQAGTPHVDPKGRRYVQFRIVLTNTTARSGPGQVDFQMYRDAWTPWPPPLLEDEEDSRGQNAGGGGVG